MKQDERGSSLLMAMIVTAVLSFLAAASLVYTGQEASSARMYQRREMLSSCATAARNWIMSHVQIGAAGAPDLLKVTGKVDIGDYIIHSGHMDDMEGDAGFPPAMVQVPDPITAGLGPKDITNITKPRGTGYGSKRTYRAVVTCEEKETKALTEVEFEIHLAM